LLGHRRADLLTIDEVRWAASATCFELRLCSTVARAISATRELASRDETRIFSSSSPALRERSTPFSTASIPRPIAVTALLDSCCTAWIRDSISWVLWVVRWARVFTWFATTAKALPCSPAWAAMMAALRRAGWPRR
jgi:hypothetical protein